MANTKFAKQCSECKTAITNKDPGGAVSVGLFHLDYHHRCKPKRKEWPYGTFVAQAKECGGHVQTISETCWTCGDKISPGDPGEKLYDGSKLMAIKHTRCEFAPQPNAIDALMGVLKEPPASSGEPDLKRRVEIMARAMEAIIRRIESSEGYFPWETERRARIRLTILVTLVSMAALAALLTSAVALWRTL